MQGGNKSDLYFRLMLFFFSSFRLCVCLGVKLFFGWTYVPIEKTANCM